ncbi:MAG: nitroreductase family protein, partial [Granulosicoccaceae bacterium]
MNHLIDTLVSRASHAANTLIEPAPSTEQLEILISCALSAPDHGKLRPWHFVAIEGEARGRLGQALRQAAQVADPALSDDKAALLESKPLRAPMIIACLTHIIEDLPKVPVFEQILSTGAAVQQLQIAANAMGYGCVWLSGPYCNTAPVKDLLKAADKDLVAGFIYIGTPEQAAPSKPRP